MNTFCGPVRERITSSKIAPEIRLPKGVLLRTFVSEECGAHGFSTGTSVFSPHAELDYHSHPFSEAITIFGGEATVVVEGRHYQLSALDAIHIPAETAHFVRNSGAYGEMVAHWAFASAHPSRTIVQATFPAEFREGGNPGPDDPETIRRSAHCDRYELSEGALFVDLFAGRFGAKGICGGYGEFAPGASLPCHIHNFDESITIVGGRALCLVQGERYQLEELDTAFVPTGHPHRFVNESSEPMSMLWVYAGDEPDRKLVAPGYCDGSLAWPGASGAMKI